MAFWRLGTRHCLDGFLCNRGRLLFSCNTQMVFFSCFFLQNLNDEITPPPFFLSSGMRDDVRFDIGADDLFARVG